MKEYIIPENVKNAILSYLQERPWKDVHQGIMALLQLKEHKPEESEIKKE